MNKEIQKVYKNKKGEIVKDKGEYPTQKHLYKNGRSSLVKAAHDHHGGYVAARERMGYESENKPYGFWKKWENFKSEMNKEIQKVYKNEQGEIVKDKGEYPTRKHLRENGRSDLEGATQRYYGNHSEARERMGYPPIDWSERLAYISRRGHVTEKIVIELLKEWMDENGFKYSDKKQTKVAPGKELECVCGEGKKIGIDVTNSKEIRTVEDKWKGKKYHKHVDQLWVIVVSNRFKENQYRTWNEESPSNVIVIDYKNLGKFLNSIESATVKFEIPSKKRAQLDALAKCTFKNREKVKREYRTSQKQKKLNKFF